MHYFKGMTHYEYLRSYYPAMAAEMEKLKESRGIPDSEEILWGYLREKHPSLVGDSQGKRLAAMVAKALNAWVWKVVRDGLGDRPFDYKNMLADTGYDGALTRIRWVAEVAGDAASFIPIVMGYHYTALEAAGVPTYLVTPALAERLKYTEVRGVDCSEIRLPHRSIYVDIPPETGLLVHDVDSGDHRLVGAYLAEDHEVDGDSVVRRLRIFLVGEPKREVGGVPDDTTMFFNLLLRDDWSLEQSIADSDERIRGSRFNVDNVVGRGWRQIFSWLLNFILYVTWSEPDEEKWESNEEFRRLWNRVQKLPKGSKKREDLKRRLKGLQSRPRIVVGRGVQPMMTEKVASAEAERRKISGVFRVSGHWKRQRYGEGRSQVKRIFIQPYWKGLEESVLGKQSPKKYEVR